MIKNRHSRLIPEICLILALVALTSQGARGQVFLGTPDGSSLAGAGGAPLSTPPPPPTVTINGSGGTTLAFMLHNLGADTSLDPFTWVSNGAAVDNDIKGYLYQWGRPTDGHQFRSSGTTTTLSSSDAPGHGDFITTNANPDDWRDTRNNDLWGSPKTANDPCPPGYRVPIQDEWQAAYDNNVWTWTGNGYEIDTNSDGTPELYLPAAGKRGIEFGTLSSTGINGHYWTSSHNDPFSLHISFDSGGVYWNSARRAFGYSVRCLAE